MSDDNKNDENTEDFDKVALFGGPRQLQITSIAASMFYKSIEKDITSVVPQAIKQATEAGESVAFGERQGILAVNMIMLALERLRQTYFKVFDEMPEKEREEMLKFMMHATYAAPGQNLREIHPEVNETVDLFQKMVQNNINPYAFTDGSQDPDGNEPVN